jgi:hypothetical protein
MSDNNQDVALDITDIDCLENDEIIKEFAEKQGVEFLSLLVREIKDLRKRIKKLEKKLKR